ncbi:MAG: DNA ligase-associated DEXH box helicase, partial [Phycisphaerae bacterium]|nr:DNA ligase-associated DEXH box helicase [Phycisphaerae bacterium]
REIARVAGLVKQRDHRAERSGRQVQAGATLIEQVFRTFEPDHPLLRQAEREVLDRHFEDDRLAGTLRRLASEPLRIVERSRPGPLSLPLVAARVGTSMLSTETLGDRLRALLREKAALA